MRRHMTVQTPGLRDYPELARVWEASVRATHDFLPDSYICLLRELLLSQYLDAVMLICCKDARQRVHGFAGVDRKSTRLNSSHSSISYAVFCLKKKKK